MNIENNKILYGIGGIVLGLILAVIFAPMMRYGGMMSWGNNQNQSTRTGITSSIDQHFIEQMIPHHEGAIAMANLALTEATHPEIKTLAEAILKAQTDENQQMQSWYQDWFGRAVPKGSAVMGGMMSQGGMHMGSSQDIDTLKNATDFDKEFIEQMIPHHQMAIMMARMLEAGTNRPEMQQLAKNIIKSQSEEIQQMQDWYTNWYK
jgi:uncharacterized protein (DUF305 family)